MTKKIIKMRNRLNLQKGYEEGEVKEHDHIAKKYQGSAQQNCNLNLTLNKNIPVVFHNFQNYDSHLTFQEIEKSMLYQKQTNFTTPQPKKKYI